MARTRTCLSVLLSVFLIATMLAPVAVVADEHEDQPRVLVFSATAGFRHASIPAGIAAVEALGQEHGFAVDATEDASQFTEANLAQYDAVVWLSTTGSVLDAEQQAAFESYIEGGGGYAGIHSASDTHYDWDWYGGLVGAYFQSHPSNQTAEIVVADQAHPSTEHLPAVWERFDEWYNFQTNPRDDVHVLMTLDETTYNAGGGSMGLDHPIAWCQVYEGGRSWYTGGGHTNESFSEDAFTEHMAGGIMWAAGMVVGDCGGTVWDNYEKIPLDTATSNPMELDVAPDGRVFYIERNGDVRVIAPDTLTTTTIGHVDVYTGQENGLLGLALDPDFATNNWLYMFYSPPNAVVGDDPRQHVSRFTVAEDGSLDLASEQVLLEIPHQRVECCHSGGSLQFDPDGDLYIATGDDTNPFASAGYTPIDERPGREAWDAQRTSANTNDLRGKILRITPEPDGTATIPDGNLFEPGTELTRPEIYAMGFRNPFRIEMDTQTGRLLVADYGPDAGGTFNDDRGPEGRVEWNVVDEPGNYGWPYCHGGDAYRDYDFATNQSGDWFDCEGGPINDSPNNTGLEQLPPNIEPEVYYGRWAQGTNRPELGTGGAPMAGPVYRFDPDLDSDTKWPAYFDGQAMFYEWGSNQLWEFVLDGDFDVRKANRILPNETFLRPMDMTFGEHDGAMYLIEWGSGFGGNNADSGIYRIDYTGGQVSPIARASANPSSGPAPLTVEFSSAGSGHPQGLSLTYTWDFGDGATSDESDPTHTYTDAGNYTAVLVVTDSEGREATANVTIVVGNTRPEVEIEVPSDGGFFDFGDAIPYRIDVFDAEDGSTEDGTIDCGEVELQSSLGHATHAHPIEVLNGCEGTLQTTRDDGHAATEKLFWVLEASYADAGGDGGAGSLTGRHLITLNPKRMQAQHFDATGRTADGQGGGDPGVQTESTDDPMGGAQNVGWIEDGDWISFETVNLHQIDQLDIRVASDVAGGTIEIRSDAPDGDLIGSVEVSNTGGWQNWEFVSTEVEDPGETFDIYFVVRRPAGSTSTTGLLNINFVDFVGDGVTDQTVPQVTASATPTSGDAPLDVEFTGEASSPVGDDIVAYDWDFDDGGATAEGPDASHTYTEPGTYRAVLTATDSEGRTGSAGVTITVDSVEPPPAGDLVCLGDLSDDFSGDELDRDRWSRVVREDQGGYSLGGGSLTMEATATDIYGTNNTGTPNIILQPLPESGPWEATLRLTMEAYEAYQQAGLIVYGDDDNYAKMVLQGRDTSNVNPANRIFQFIREENGTPNEVGDSNTGQLGADYPDTVWVRFSSDGSDLRASYSADGIEFTDMPQTKQMAGMDDPHIGLLALAGNGRPETTVDFEQFLLRPDDSVERPELYSDEFEGDELDGCRWDRVVRYDPETLEVTGGQLLIETPEGDIYGGSNDPVTNFILQNQPEGDWTIETRLQEELAGGFSQAGLMVHVDDDNYVKFDVIADQNQSQVSRIELRSEIDGQVQDPQANLDAPDNDGEWWLRLTKDGDDFSGQVSTDGEDWIDFPATVTNAPAAAEGGMGVFTLGVNGPLSTVAFDHFRLLGEEPTDPEDLTVEASLDPADPDGDDGWHISPVALTLESNDEAATLQWRESGSEEWVAWTEPVTFDLDGVHELEYRATRDDPAEATEPGQVSFRIDQTAPETEASLEGEQDGDVYTADVTVTLDATDETSGVAETQYRMAPEEDHLVYDGPFVISEDGDHTVEFRSQDVAGNVEGWQSITFTIDTSDPEPTQPSHRDDCMKGGWRDYSDPEFRNQGECLAWVSRPPTRR